MKVAFIPVRGGSKSIPKKNIRSFCGRPLLYWAASAAQYCDSIDKVVIATDSMEIAETAKSFGFSKLEVYMRDPENAQDTSSTESVMLEYLKTRDLRDDDVFVLMQATTPFTRAEDLDSAFSLYLSGKYDSVLSAVPFKRFFWNHDGKPLNYDYKNRPRRQEFEGPLLENGAIYISSVCNVLKSNNRLSGKIGVSIMPEYAGVELDEPDDWILAEVLMRRNQGGRVRHDKLSKIRLFLSDVDGTLTDAGMYYSEDGEEMKKFSTRDGMGFELVRRLGLKVGIITKENSPIVAARAKKLKLDIVEIGIEDKVKCITKICKNENILPEEVLYIGDDVNDLEILKLAGFSSCPSDATKQVISSVDYVCSAKGGRGCVREVADLLIDNYIK